LQQQHQQQAVSREAGAPKHGHGLCSWTGLTQKVTSSFQSASEQDRSTAPHSAMPLPDTAGVWTKTLGFPYLDFPRVMSLQTALSSTSRH